EPEHEGMPANGPDRRFMAMPAYIGGRFNNTGVKLYGSNAENRKNDLPRSIHVFVLHDTVPGAPKSRMSAHLPSAYRTGAIPAVGVPPLAVDNTEEVGIIGPGIMSRTILASSITQRPSIKRVKIKGRTAASTSRTADYLREKHPGIEFSVVETEQEAIENSDILIAGSSTSPVGPHGFSFFKNEWLKPRALVF